LYQNFGTIRNVRPILPAALRTHARKGRTQRKTQQYLRKKIEHLTCRQVQSLQVIQQEHSAIMQHASDGDITELIRDRELPALENMRYIKAARAGARNVAEAREKARANSTIKKSVDLHNIADRAELFNGKIIMVASPGKGYKLMS
jgi:hypothetical protein